LLKEKIIKKLQSKKINWIKIYASKNNSDEFIGEFIINGEYWDEGLEALKNYALSWQSGNNAFLAIKQFILFRVCDKYDDVLHL
jgi:hypothetical protein